MSKIVQFSTIGALMSGYSRGECDISTLNHPHAFGLGCSQGINGELTIFEGKIWEATAGKPPHPSHHRDVPFVQVTEFQADDTFQISDINQDNIEQHLKQHIALQNIFLAVCIEATFKHLLIRRPQPATDSNRSIGDFAATQQEDSLKHVQGHLIGFWTPALFGRISVPGFHFHFIDYKNENSGHVLEFSSDSAQVCYQEKQTIEITNPHSDDFKKIDIDISVLDNAIDRVEK